MSARARKLRQYQNNCLEGGFDQVFLKSLCEEEDEVLRPQADSWY